MDSRFLFLVFVVGALVVSGCVGSSPSGVSSNASTENESSNASLAPNASAGVPAKQAALCVVSSGDQVELFLFDESRYVYELTVGGRTSVEMVYVPDGLYVHFLSSISPGCDWAFLTQTDLESINEFSGIKFLTHAELANQISANQCQRVPLDESVFSLPPAACSFQEFLLRSAR
ncbi:hypothetical protein HY572_04655 [Candidatus Micrarchaeota archaeon]|nr:hypothetical protein [Candidatus Micrarchaeota archaeon]